MRVDNPRNPDVKGLKRRAIASLFPGCSLHLRGITLAPPIVRTLAPHSRVICHLLERIAPLCTHSLGLIRKN
jgi:hypothetical protein